LPRSQQQAVAVQLRRRGVRTHKVRGATEQTDVFIRLADAVCGFLREALTGKEPARRLLAQAAQAGYFRDVGGVNKKPP